MKVFLVTSCSLPMLGLEKCQAFAVSPALEAAFIRQHGYRIITSCSRQAFCLPLPVIIYKGH